MSNLNISQVVINATQFMKYATIMISLRMPFMVKGNVGIGKSEISIAAAIAAGIKPENVFVETPHLKEPTDYLGFPFIYKAHEGEGRDAYEADFLPLGKLRQIMQATEPTHVILDELDKASEGVMNAVAQLILQREVAGVPVPDCVSFSACGNLRSNKSGSRVFPTHLVDRFEAIWQLEPTIDEWVDYALAKDLPMQFIAFNKMKPDQLFSGQQIDLAQDLQKSPTPRTCTKLGLVLKQGNRDETFLYGFAGKGYVAEYLAFERMFTELPDLDFIIANPLTAEVPPANKIDVQYAICTALAMKATPDNYPAILKYIEREEFQNKFAVCIGYYIVTKNPDIKYKQNKCYMDWATRHQEVLVK